jgi:ribosomal protein S18 acetylase RimI-like enzyme
MKVRVDCSTEVFVSHPSYAITVLGSADLTMMKELLAVYGRAFEDAGTYGDAIPRDSYLARLLAKPDFITIVALFDGTVVGGLSAYVLEKFEQERSEIYIYDLAVAEPHRRRGVATALIRALQEVGRTRGAYVMFVQADRGDDPAIALYTRLGTREDVHHFDIAMTPV